ncbi:NADH-quinone oxidoreductase subunit NuoK [Patescibacteria group bacterium]|nr:NADH-quinone oxidoreductase subunit NuoK [Patescibacteria group bacterium]
MSDQLSSYLILSSALLSLGIYGILSRKNIVAILISIELILSAANLNFLAFNRFLLPDKGVGQIFAIFVIALAAAEVCVALSIALLITRKNKSVFIDDAKELKG